jgi:hypothetical protein
MCPYMANVIGSNPIGCTMGIVYLPDEG